MYCFPPSNDINEIVELWLFLRRHSLASSGISQQAEIFENIQIFPNPANGKVTVSGLPTGNSENTVLSVYNIQGKLMLQQTVQQPTTGIDISGLANGTYLLKLKNGNNSAVRAIVKE
ncbi:MAG: T9SS type A sorting domain-containing protein [Bacteroidetes bacterium]|nr:T9SS type A sorting domain-containing protein [Bacteroidota bacterium]